MPDFKSILESLGYSPKDFGDHLRMRSNYRNGDNNTSLVVFKTDGRWNDYGVGLTNQPFSKLVEFSGGKIPEGGFGEFQIEHQVKREDDSEFSYPPEILNRLLPHYKFYEDKGISQETLMTFRGGLATQGKMYQRYVFPIFSESGKIVGFSGRNASPSSDRPKWKHLGKKNEWLYPLNLNDTSKRKCVEDVLDKGYATLVESIGDTLSYTQNFGWNCFCCFSLSVPSKLIAKLIEIGAKKVCISMNNDCESDINRGLLGAIKAYIKLLEFYDKDDLRIVLPVKNDFGEMDSEDFEKWERKRVDIFAANQYPKILSTAESFFRRTDNGKELISKSAIEKLRKA